MTEVRRVLLLQPLEGARWRSITAYAGSVHAMLRAAGVEIDVAEVPWFNPPSLISGVRRRWWRHELIRAARDGRYDIVHLTDQALAHHVPGFRAGAAVVVTCHDLMPFTLPGYYTTARERRLKQAFQRKAMAALPMADAVVAVSDFTRGELRARFGASFEAAVVPNVLRPAFRGMERAEAEARLGAAGIELPAAPRVVSVGNDRAYKNLEALIRVMAETSLAHASLVRVGPLTGTQLALARSLGVLRRTVFPDAREDETLAALYAASDVLAQPSRAEGFGIPVIEAMACGLPVAVSDGGSLPEVVREAGLVVPLGPAFEKRFAAALGEAVRRRDLLRPDGLARAEQFRPAAVAPRLLEVYERAIRRRRESHGPKPGHG